MGYLDAPGMLDGAEDRLLVFAPHPADLEVMVPAEPASRGGGDPAVHQDQLEVVGDALPVQCSSIGSLARLSWVETGTTRGATGSPVTSTATKRLAPLVRP